MKKIRIATWILLATVIGFLWGCGGGSGGSVGFSSGSGDTGRLSLSLVDAPGGEYEAVYVTIKAVQVCHATYPCDAQDPNGDCGCQWETVATLEKTYNLLELVNGVMAALGQKDLEAGTYNQMRLLLHDEPDDTLNILGKPHPYPQYLIDTDDQERFMKIPSGYQTGIKLVHPFEIVKNLTMELILDFDVAKSVIKAGNSGKYLLKPTIKVIGTYNRAVVSGIVETNEATPLPIENASIAAWHEDSEGNWGIAVSTFTDSNGGYTLYLDLGGESEPDPKEYKIVAMADGYEPDCSAVTVEADHTYPGEDFQLSTAEMATVSGTITGTAPMENNTYPSDAPLVRVSFSRLIGECFTFPVETAFVQTTDDQDDETEDVFYNSGDGSFHYRYSIQIPAALYDAAATATGLDPVAVNDFIAVAPEVVLGFDFDQ